MIQNRWLFLWHPSASAQRLLEQVAAQASCLLPLRSACQISVLIGIAPVLLANLLQLPIHQLITAILLTPILLACVLEDRLGRAMFVVGLSLILHSAVVIFLSARDPNTEAILPGAAKYWSGIWLWISTGYDQEYRWADWLPEHLKLFAGLPIATYPSFGLLPFTLGIEQLDLMNYYVGRLISVSQSPTKALLLGWHPWSLLRGTAYTVLIFEVTSLSLQRFLRRSLATPRSRIFRWIAAALLAIADGALKYWLAPILREGLYANLTDEARFGTDGL